MARKDVKTAVKDAGKAAKELFNKAQESVTHTIDVNGDGKFDFNDIKQAAEGVSGKAQKVATNIKDSFGDTKKKLDEKTRANKVNADLKALRPIFMDDLSSTEFTLPKLLMLADGPDKAHKESEACKDSVGFKKKSDKMDIVTIYKEDADVLGVEFYPDDNGEVYYVDPTDRDHYISLDDYFGYLKTARIQELQKVAQDLGAKSFNVEYWEEQSEVQKRGIKPHASVKPEKKGRKKQLSDDNTEILQSVSGEIGFENSKTDTNAVRIVAQMEFLGGRPVRPALRYLAKETEIIGLIDQRMAGNPLLSKSVTIELRKSSGISMKDALLIGAVIKDLKCTAGISFVKDAEKEFRSKFKYNIKF